MAAPIVKIDFNVNDEPASVRAFVERLATIDSGEKPKQYQIDMSACQYLGPDAAALLGAILLDAKRQGPRLTLTWPNRPAALRGFCEYSGLKEVASDRPYQNRDFDPQYNVLRLRIAEAARFRDADPVISLVRSHGTLSLDTEEYLRLCINEVLQNIVDHAKSPIGGVMSARYIQANSEVRVAIVDRGEGICTTLRRRYPDTTQDNALQRVLEGKFTTLSRKYNAGLGINHLKSIVCTLGGSLHIISEKAIARAHKTELRSDLLNAYFRGVGVFFTLPVGNDPIE